MDMRRLLLALIGIGALSLLIACGGGSKKTPGATSMPKTSATQTPAGQATQQEVTPAISFADACQKTNEKSFSSVPPRIIDTSKTYVATIKTAKGDIVVQLFSDTPITTNNFVFLACKGFYDGLTFHRVVAAFVIQGGDPTGTGGGGPGYAIPDEADGNHKMDVGVISMAKSGPNTTGSQFFVTIGLGSSGSLAYLDPDFTVFGKVTSGQDIAGQIQQGDKMNTVTMEEK
jgi:cyclophilin family peptidyl-prolyl cis-trans isomerase